MKRGIVLAVGILVILVIAALFMLRSPASGPEVQDADAQTPSIEELNEESSAEDPALNSDDDVFNEFDASLEGMN